MQVCAIHLRQKINFARHEQLKINQNGEASSDFAEEEFNLT